MQTETAATPRSLLVHRLAHEFVLLLGPRDCRKRGIGKLRAELAADLGPNVLGQGARREAAQILQSHCRLCGRCRLAHE